MQDRNYEKMTAKGWESMKTTLDKEMPVQRGRRRLLVLIFFLGIAVSSAAAWWYMSEEVKEEVYVNVLKENQLPPVSGNRETENIDDHSSKGEESSQNALINNENHGPAKKQNTRIANDEIFKEGQEKEQPQILIERSISKKPKDRGTSRKIVGEFLSTEVSSSEKAKDKVAEKESSSELADVLIGSERSLESKLPIDLKGLPGERPELSDELGDETKDEERKIYPDLVPLKLVRSLAILTNKEDIEVPSPFKQKRFLPLEFRIEAGAMASIFNNLRGAYAGLTLEKAVSRRWSLRSGLAYQDLTELTVFSQLESADNSIITLDPSEVNGELEDQGNPQEFFGTSGDYQVSADQFATIYSKVNRLYLVSIPFSAMYKVTRKSQVGIGVNYSYLLGVRNGSIDLAELEPSLAVNNARFGNDGLQNAGVVKRNFISANGAYRFKISRKLGIHTGVNLGIGQLLKTSENQGLRNSLTYVNLGIDYKL